MSAHTFVPVVIEGGRQKHVVACAGSERAAEHACARLARSYQQVFLQEQPQGKPEAGRVTARWFNGRRVA